MPVDPMIARGVEAPNFANALIAAEELKNRQQYNALAQQRIGMEQQQYGDERAAAEQAQRRTDAVAKLKFLYEPVKRGDTRAIQAAAQTISDISPEAFRELMADPANLAPANFGPALGRMLGIEEPAPLTKPTIETQEGYSYLWGDKGVVPGSVQAPQRAPLPRPSSGAAPAAASTAPKPAKPIPTSALKIVDEANQAIAAASDSKKLVTGAIALLTPDPETKKPKVELGAVENQKSRAKNFSGYSDDNSRAYADIRQTLEKLRNNYLLLAKGVQTEGDAQRAWNSEIGENVQNDNALALQQLEKAQGMIDRAIKAQNRRIETVYRNFNSEPPSAPPVDSQQWPTPPQAAIDALMKDPGLAAQFVQKYGRLPQGFSARP